MSNDAELRIGANTDDVKLGIDKAVATVREGMAKMAESAEVFNKGISNVTKVFSVFTEALMLGAVGEQFVEFVKHTAEVGDQLLKTSQKIGVSVEELSKLKYAAELSDVSFEDLSGGLKKLAVGMENAHQGVAAQKDAFDALGIAVDDAQGNLRSIDQVLPQIAEKFAKMEDGAGKTALAVRLFGKSGSDLIPFLNAGADGLKKMGEEADRLGIVWNTETTDAAERMNDDIKRMHASMEGVSTHAGQIMIPVFDTLANAFSKSMQAGGLLNAILNGLAFAFKFIVVAAVPVVLAIEALGKTFGALLAVITHPLDAKNIFSALRDDIKQTADDLNKFSSDLLNGAAPAAKKEESKGHKSKPPALSVHGGGSGSSSQSDTRLAEWKDELTQKKEVESDYFKSSLAMEEQFWQAKLASITGNGKQDVALRRQINGELYNLHKQQAQQQMQLDDEAISFAEQRGLESIAIKRDELADKLTLGQISNTQQLAGERDLLDQEYAIQRMALEDRAKLQKDDLVASQKTKDQLILLEMKHARDVAKINTQSALETQKTWSTLKNSMSNLWDQGINAMMNGTLRWSNAVRAIGTEMVKWFMTGVVKPKVMAWVTGEESKTGATLAGTAQRAAAETMAAAKSVALWAATAVKNIMSSAWEAMAGAWKAMVGIPYIGPVLAVAAAGAAFAGVSALAANVSAEGGYDIPSGVNPLVQTHQREMILPAKYADTIRNMADSGSGGSGGENHFHIHAVDRRGIEDLLRSNGHILAREMRRQSRNFSPTNA